MSASACLAVGVWAVAEMPSSQDQSTTADKTIAIRQIHNRCIARLQNLGPKANTARGRAQPSFSAADYTGTDRGWRMPALLAKPDKSAGSTLPAS